MAKRKHTNPADDSGLMHVQAPCRACGTPVPVVIERGARPPVKMCWPCLNHPTRHIERTTSDSELRYVTKAVTSQSLCGPVTVFRPGDPGFAERADQVLL